MTTFTARLGAAIIALTGVSSIMPSVAAAQLSPGTLRIGSGIGAFTYTDIDIDGITVKTKESAIGPSGDLRLGYVATQLLEVGINFGVENVDVEIGLFDDSVTSWTLGPYVELNYPVGGSGRAILAPGLGISYSSAEGTGIEIDAVEFRLGLTLKYFLIENASIDAGMEFSYFTGDAKVERRDVDADGWSIGPRVGISIWPR